MKNLYTKKLALLLFISLTLLTLVSNAKNYYIAANGSDANTGLSAAAAWKTVAKVNTSFSTFLAGDSILFKSGDTFYGNLVIAKSGTASKLIVISAYGSGTKPVITGFTTISGWTNEGAGIYSKLITSAALTNMVTIDDRQYAMGRYPDAAYLSYETFSTTISVTDNTLGTATNWAGAEAVIRKNDWTIDRTQITNHTANTLTYTSLGSTSAPINNNFGYFIQNDLRTLTIYGEWYHNITTGKFYMYFGAVDPNTKTVKFASTNYVISNAGFDYVTIDNINLTGSIDDAVHFTSTTDYCNIQNCEISFAGKNGVSIVNGSGDLINADNVSKINGLGIVCDGTNTSITNNTVLDIGLIAGQVLGSGGCNGIYSPGNNVVIRNNTVRRIGATGIVLKYSGAGTIQYNLVDSACMTFDDGGGIYTSGPDASARLIDHNIILNTVGNNDGTPDNVPISAGIYLDEQATNVTVSNNSIANINYAAIKFHKAHEDALTDNSFFNNKYGIGFFNDGGSFIRNISLKGNISVAKTATQQTLRHQSSADDVALFGIADSNYYLRPVDDNLSMSISQPSTGNVTKSLSSWQAFTNQDALSKKSPRTVTDVNDLRFEYNASGTARVVSLGAVSYLDAKGAGYTGSVTIPAWGSLILIANGAAPVPNQLPLANAGSDKIITLPTNSATLTGGGTDADGTISSYAWTKISGPSSGTIATAGAATTAVNNLTQGTYQYQLLVTDNKGATAKDTIQLTVNPAPNQRPIATIGADKLITLPTNSTSITGSATDVDGTISSYAWVKISGPSAGTIVNASSATTTVNNLVQGIYKFELTATDNSGAIAKDTLTVTVNAAPVVNAGADKLISLPTNTITLSGTATDADGSISSYSWAKISGPSSAAIATANASITLITNLVQGVYQFELTATDNTGAASKDSVMVTVNAAPVVNAGADKLISLPTNTITLSGTATDADGSISSYSWAKISGPSSAAIATANAATTVVNNLIKGVYQFELTVADNSGALSKDTVIVTVNATPVVNAGADKLINLPTNWITLNGTATDSDGIIGSYSWAKISGPSSGAIATTNTATTTINGLVKGVYQFELSATDNSGAISKDTLTVTFNAPPIVNAGTDKLISLPTNTITLTGTATDADGSISSYSWAKISGPSSAAIATANASTTLITNLVQGVYQFELTATDNNGSVSKDTIIITVNAAPFVNAGADKLISLPANTITLSGTATDADGSISSYSWIKISGPSSATIATANASATLITNLVQGVYQFELTATDNNGAISKDTVIVTVNAAPVANAGADKLINLPVNNTGLNGNGTDIDGSITGYSWIQISGPAFGTITNGNAATAVLSGLVQGVYQFELTATDNDGSTGKDTVQVTVNAVPNAAPAANAGADNIITLPANTVTLSGNGTDTDGTISNYAWVKISGPSSGTIATPNTASTVLNSLVQGIYQYELTVTDNYGAIGKDTLQVTVNLAPNAVPVAKAGIDKTITWPTSTASLSGSGTDSDGTVTKYAWVKISGPASGKITPAGSAATSLSGLVQGTYLFELTVTDNKGTTGKDTVQVFVNQPPVANAGNDTTITLPVNTSILTSSSTDVDGTISTYSWTKTSGPTTGKIATANAAATLVNSLVAGIYKYVLTVTDNNGGIAKDTVQVTVNAAANQAPVSNAGPDKMITLPTNNVTLSGKGTDVDGTISAYAWLQISGPLSGNIVTQNAASTVLNSLTAGVYQYELTVTDNSGATAKDTVQITVNAALNLAPKANAGPDNIIVLPSNSAILTGIGTDADGTVTSYAWVQISGPVLGTVGVDTAAITSLTNLTDGVYQYELTVTDNSGAIGKDTVMISVNAVPVAKAGIDKTITWPTSTASLSGSGTDSDGTVTKYAWVKISGPASGKITPAGSAATSLSGLVQGTYLFELTVTDNKGTTGKDTVQVFVNQPPVANAGNDTTITLPVNTSILTSSSTDVDGTISTYSWTKTSGPTTGKIATANAAATLVNSLVAGIYKYVLTVTDNNGGIAKDTVQVTVNAAANQAPVSNAGPDKMITLPTNNVTLSGKGTDVDGIISAYAWLQISGPLSGNIVTQNAASTVLNSLTAGVYQYELTVTDNSGATAKDTVQITVNAALNLAPKANAGPDNIIVLPSNSAILTGIGTDADGTVTSYAWVQISGPVLGTVGVDTAAITSLTNLTDGVYQYELTVTDNSGAIGKDTVMISVNAVPVAKAGIDKTITWPTSTASLSGSGTDSDGTVTKYAWVKISGPASGKITPAGSAATSLSGLVQGTYLFELTVTDNKGTTGKDTVQVFVNQPPVANAGNDTTITLPVNTSILTSSSTDVDGTISTYSWTKISGPAAGKIAVANAATTGINSLVQGVYTYVLTVTDNNGGTTKDTVQVTVNAASTARSIVTGKVLALPVASVSNELKVYPNPVNDVANLNITTNGSAKLYMYVTDMSGRMVKSGEINNPGKGQTFKLNMSDFQDGYYIISVRFADGQMINSKVLKYGGK